MILAVSDVSSYCRCNRQQLARSSLYHGKLWIWPPWYHLKIAPSQAKRSGVSSATVAFPSKKQSFEFCAKDVIEAYIFVRIMWMP